MIDSINKCVAPYRKRGSEKENTYDADIPCGRCIPCLRKRALSWAFRLYHENRASLSAYFITLTYDTDNLPIVDCRPLKTLLERNRKANRRTYEKWKNDHTKSAKDYDKSVIVEKLSNKPMDFRYEVTLWKKDLQMFIDRLRKREFRHSKRSIKYYACGEYGSEGGRPHYHLIVFNLSKKVLADVSEIWDMKGIVDVKPVTDGRICYVAKYVVKPEEDHSKKARPFSIQSQGLGSNYLTTDKIEYHKDGSIFYGTHKGIKCRLPRYYVNKIWDINNDELSHEVEGFPVSEGVVNRSELRIHGEQVEEELMFEYWKKWSELKEKGIHDPDAYMAANKKNAIEIEVKRSKERK